MEYTSQEELYMALLPAFQVKKRLNSITEFSSLTNNDIWKYLAVNKWRSSTNLTISEMANDIISVDSLLVHNFVGGQNEKR